MTKNDNILVNFDDSKLELHIFCDANESAYSFSIYARMPLVIERASSLITAKSKLAQRTGNPSQIGTVCHEYRVKDNKGILEVLSKLGLYPRLYAYSDSTIALSWVKSQPYRLQTFVANGVVTIQQVLKPEIWYHDPTKQNPADIATNPIDSKHL